MIRYLIIALSIVLMSCGYRESPAPVVESQWQPYHQSDTVHRVARGETLYAIAFRYEMDYQHLAQINHLSSPYSLRIGQVLNIHSGMPVTKTISPKWSPPVRQKLATVVSRPSIKPSTVPTKNSSAGFFHRLIQPSRNKGWIKPAEGKIVTQFLPGQGKKGIDIAGKSGDKIRASADGVVAYAGTGLSGYGNLIIIKHNNQYLTAYGNNKFNLVHEGQKIKAGQIIAEMGVIDRRYYGVHFEIRQSGKPVNPLNYL